MGSRWSDDADRPSAAAYDERFASLARQGIDVHGEAHLVEALLDAYRSEVAHPEVLDAGCGTGRVAIRLAGQGLRVVGVDLDEGMLARARAAAPDLEWVEADLAGLQLDRTFDAAVLAGNVLIFVAPGTESRVVARVASHLKPGGLLICGFQVHAGGYGPDELDRDALGAGMRFVARWSTWDRAPWPGDHSYQVSLHQLAPPSGSDVS